MNKVKIWWEYQKELIGDAAIISFSGLLFFYMIVVEWWGAITLVEYNDIIRRGEIGMLALLLIIGVDRSIDDLRKRHWRD